MPIENLLNLIISIIVISQAITGIIFAILWLIFKDRFDNRYTKRDEVFNNNGEEKFVKLNDVPCKKCYEEFLTLNTYKTDLINSDKKMESIKTFLSDKIESTSQAVHNQLKMLTDLISKKF